MTSPIRQSALRVAMLGFILLAPIFLMGDFCQDVLTVPIVVDYTGDDVDLVVHFVKKRPPSAPEPDEDDVDLDPDGYPIEIRRQTIDFADSSKGGANLSRYEGNIDGVFIRSVTYSYAENTIPGNVPPMNVYLSPLVQQEGADGSDDRYLDWEALIEAGELDDLYLPDNGVGDYGLVKLGQTERRYFDVAVEDFPSNELRLIRETANLDDISEMIKENFAFEMLILPQGPVVIEERNRDMIPEDRKGRVSFAMRFVVVVAAKP